MVYLAQKNKTLVTSLFVGFVGILVTIAFIQNPPQTPEEHNHEAEQQQSQVMSGKLQDINLSAAKVINIQPKELADANCANEIAGSLNRLNAVGELTIDLAKKIVTVQYDSSKVDENNILEAFAAVQHEAVILQNPNGPGIANN